jgi:hypothetical protein
MFGLAGESAIAAWATSQMATKRADLQKNEHMNAVTA